tara:strand:+ start:1055 stop:2311 length:1257 start_codon:yes stop_codon:yes gene_type:complete
MKKLNKRNKKKVTRRKRYATAGMYAENQIPAGIGSTAMTVYQEDNPEIQAKREAALQAETEGAITKTEDMAKEIDAEKAQDADKIAAAKQEADAQSEGVVGMTNQALTLGEGAGLFGEGNFDAATQAKKDKQSTLGALKSARNIYQGTRSAKKTMDMVQGFNKAKTAFDVSQRLKMGEQAWKMKKTFEGAKQSLDATKSMLDTYKTGKMTLDGFKTADQIKQSTSLLKTPLVEMSTTMGKDGYMAASKSTQAMAKGSAIGKGLKDFATSGAGIGLIASGAGYAAKKIWGDDDDTKYNAGEVTGDILSGVGTGMSTAAALGTVVPGVGNVAGAIVGGLYGLGKGLYGQAKAKKAASNLKHERAEKIKAFNKEVGEDLGAQMVRKRAGEVKQKSYSGYDLGRNVTARRGGYRGMPRYAYA